jgi:RNA polymerase sigma-70 factor, ECF subfamily
LLVNTKPALLDVFRASQGEAEGDEAALRAFVDAARAAWPHFGVTDEELVRYAAERLPSGKLPPVAHAADLMLACACCRGTPAAIAAFCAAYGTVVARVLSRRRASFDVADDAAQSVFERLLAAPAGSLPKITEYKGSGPLRSWVSTTAATTLAMMQRAAGRRREQQADGAIIELTEQADPELRFMKEHYKAEIADAIVAALSQLGDRERALLRLHVGEGMSVDRLGALYKVNRATAARWIAAARESLALTARDQIRERLKLRDSEYESIVALVRSQLDVSIARHLA